MGGPVTFAVINNNLPLLSQLDPLMKASLKRVMNEIGADLAATAIKAIQNQMPPDETPWTELQEWWVAWKKTKGYSEQIYIMTSSYMQAITWKMEETANDMQTVVGVMRTAGYAPNGDMELWKVGEILEYGWEEFNVRIPPRPLWRPTLAVKKRSIQTKVGTAVYWATKQIQKQAKGNTI